MIIRTATDEDRRAWDAFAAKSEATPPYYIYAWKRILESSYRLRTHFFMAVADDGTIRGIFPTYITKTFRGKKNLFGLRYGLLADDEETRVTLYEHAMSFCAEQGVRSALIPAGFQSLEAPYTETIKKTLLLDLAGTEEQTWDSFRDKTRNMIRKAERGGLEIETGWHNVGAFYDIYASYMQAIGVFFHSRSFFVQMGERLGERVELISAKKDGAVIAAMVLLYGGQVASYPFQSAKMEYRKFAPNQFLIWEAIKRCIARGITRLDMGESKVGSSVYKFKTNFGGVPHDLHYYSDKPRVDAPLQAADDENSLSETEDVNSAQPAQSLLAPAVILDRVLRQSPFWLSKHLAPRIKNTGRII